jgi:hypothetical protein
VTDATEPATWSRHTMQQAMQQAGANPVSLPPIVHPPTPSRINGYRIAAVHLIQGVIVAETFVGAGTIELWRWNGAQWIKATVQ